VSVELLIDNSAWVRLAAPALPQKRADQVADWLEDGRVAACLPFVLEAGCSARSAADHDELMQELGALPRLHIDEEVERRAIDGQRQLARAGHHRLPPVDLLLAALADRYGVGILHYDGDFDVIAAKTNLRFESRWLAKRGAL